MSEATWTVVLAPVVGFAAGFAVVSLVLRMWFR